MKTSWHKTSVLAVVMILSGINAAVAVPVSVTMHKAEGTVETRMSTDAAWVKAASGEKLSAGASVKTGPASSCILKWGDGHVLKLQALSTLYISRIESDEDGNENTRLDLSGGKINAHVAKLTTRDSTFSVKTPTAIAGVRGTDLFVNVADDNTSTFGVTEGEIYVEAGGMETVVMRDFIVTVEPTGAAGAPEPMPVEMKQEAVEQTKEIKQEAQAEPEGKGKDEDKKGTGAQDKGKGAEQGKGIEKQEEKAASGNDATPAATPETTPPAVEPTDIAAAAVDTVINNVTDQQITNDIVEAAQQQMYKTGQFEVDIYVSP